MNRDAIAEGIIELWSEYLPQNFSAFPPSMTDFVNWLRERRTYETERSVKSTRTVARYGDRTERHATTAVPPVEANVNGGAAVEVSVAQPSGGATLTTTDKVQIRDLYQRGHSAARVRQMLGLKVPLSTVYLVATKKPQ